MPSTFSSAEPNKASATEALAARYRHLFTLPRTEILAISAVAVSFALSLAAREGEWLLGFAMSSFAFMLSAVAISAALKFAGGTKIATFRRVTAVLLGAQALWLVFAVLGNAYSIGTGSIRPITNAIVFGAFICAGFEFLVIIGAFSGNIVLSIGLAVVHPLSTYFVLTTQAGSITISPLATASGAVSLAVIATFPLMLRRRRTSRGYDAISLFQAFMKTWTSRDSADLERIIESHGEPASVTTKVMKFRRNDGDIYLVFPGVHPGPFYPVGSYNLPGLIAREFGGLGPVMTLHRPGGHERNLASNEQAHRFAATISKFADRINPSQAETIIGPVHSTVGKAVVSSTAIADDCLLTISFAPLGSDDLNPAVEDTLSSTAGRFGFDLSVVDAHNSISQGQEHLDTENEGWVDLLNKLRLSTPKPFSVSYAHSDEVGFSPKDDVTENGMGLLLLQTNDKSVLVLADANNAIPNLREETSKALESAGFKLIEFCTSDSHDLAAKGLTVPRGYKALGEDTPSTSIISTVVRLAQLADSRLTSCLYGSGILTSDVTIFGSKALEEFASIAQASSRFARRYAEIATASILALLALALVG